MIDASFFKDTHKDERAFLVGNGPSLKKFDMSLLDGETTFGVNMIYLLPFTPTYYLLEDRLVASDRRNEIADFTGPVKFFTSQINGVFRDTPNTDDIIWLNWVNENKTPPSFSVDADKNVFFGGTVMYIAMQLAHYMGISKLYLVGFDHNYSRKQEHGDVMTSRGEDPDHFDAGYFGPGKRFHNPRPERMEVCYQVAKEAFEKDGRKITNITPRSKLDVFPKLSYKRILRKK